MQLQLRDVLITFIGINLAKVGSFHTLALSLHSNFLNSTWSQVYENRNVGAVGALDKNVDLFLAFGMPKRVDLAILADLLRQSNLSEQRSLVGSERALSLEKGLGFDAIRQTVASKHENAFIDVCRRDPHRAGIV